jgi:DNA polymerase-4
MADSVAARLRRAGLRGRTVTLKVRYPSFETLTRAVTLERPTDSAATIVAVARRMLEAVPVDGGVRLLGVGATSLTTERIEQLSFDGLLTSSSTAVTSTTVPSATTRGPVRGEQEPAVDEQAWSAANDAVDTIRERYGPAAIGPATLVESDGLRPRLAGHSQWGSDAEVALGPSEPFGATADDSGR